METSGITLRGGAYEKVSVVIDSIDHEYLLKPEEQLLVVYYRNVYYPNTFMRVVIKRRGAVVNTVKDRLKQYDLPKAVRVLMLLDPSIMAPTRVSFS